MGVVSMMSNQNSNLLPSRTRPKTFCNPLPIRVQSSQSPARRKTRRRSSPAVTRTSTGPTETKKDQETRTGIDTSHVIKNERKIKKEIRRKIGIKRRKGRKIKINIGIKKGEEIRSTGE